MSESTATPSPEPGSAPPTRGQRISGALLIGALGIVRRLPEQLVLRAAWNAGLHLLPRLLPARRAVVRANLGRVVRWMAAEGVGSERGRAAATDARLHERLVREVFGHWALTYAESALATRYDAAVLRERVRLPGPESVREGLSAVPDGEPGRIYISIHFGAVEIAGVFAARTGAIPLAAPMEVVANPVMERYIQAVRGEFGVEVLPLLGVSGILKERIRSGGAVGIVADRPIGGPAATLSLFGAPARIPAGPAILAVETRARVAFISLARDAGLGRWIGRMDAALPAADLPRARQVQALIGDHVRWMERTIASAPEQWWTLLFPIWEEAA